MRIFLLRVINLKFTLLLIIINKIDENNIKI